MRILKRAFTIVAMLVMAISANAYHWQSPYAYCMGNPVKFVDPDGKKTVLFATKLPGWPGSVIPSATHTFVAVIDGKSNKVKGYYAFSPENGKFWGRLENPHFDQNKPKYYADDKKIIDAYINGSLVDDNMKSNNDRCKYAVSFETIDPSEQERFDNSVVSAGNSYEPIETTEYALAPSESNGTVNCNKGSYNLLKRAGVSKELLKAIGERIPGILWGWGQNMPWTEEEQRKDVNKHSGNK